MYNYNELSVWLIRYWKGVFSSEMGDFHAIKQIAELVIPYFSSDERGILLNDPDRYENEIKYYLKDLLNSDPTARLIIDKINSNRNVPTKEIVVTGNNNQLINVEGNIAVNNCGSDYQPSMMNAIFGNKTHRIRSKRKETTTATSTNNFLNKQDETMDKPLIRVEDIKFKVALSFPGEKRDYVSAVVKTLKEKIGKKDQIFYDFDYTSQLAKPNLDTLLQNIYRNNAELIVVFLCNEYDEKQWCGLEFRAIRDIIKEKDNNKIMFIRFDNAEIEGIFSIDGYIDATLFEEKKVAGFIFERMELSES
jgi:hypothetical protein